MTQLNLNITPAFARVLAQLMQLKGLHTKSEAVRVAVEEGVKRELQKSHSPDFKTWIGWAKKKPMNLKPRFLTDDELWGEKPRGR